jgi:hypothetical protein
VTVLLLASSNRKNMVERQAHLDLPELQHGIEMVRTKAKVDPVLAQLHHDASSVLGGLQRRARHSLQETPTERVSVKSINYRVM